MVLEIRNAFSQDYRKEKQVARLSRRCWSVLIRMETTLEQANLTRTHEFSPYFFQWMSASMPEEEVFNNLVSLNSGEVDVKALNKRYKVRTIIILEITTRRLFI